LARAGGVNETGLADTGMLLVTSGPDAGWKVAVKPVIAGFAAV
jgi:hypothetical protein